MPPVTSALVGVLTACTTRPSCSNTASVLVPPTSMPIRLMFGPPESTPSPPLGCAARYQAGRGGRGRRPGAGGGRLGGRLRGGRGQRQALRAERPGPRLRQRPGGEVLGRGLGRLGTAGRCRSPSTP